MRMRKLPPWCCGLCPLLVYAVQPAFAAATLNEVPRSALCVTEGSIGAAANRKLSVNVAKMRAYLNQPSAEAAEIRFTYLGGTSSQARLASGESRRQFGLKLRAADACNLVYVMWRIEPKSALVVSVKRNPGQHASAECGNRGYRNVKPRYGAPIPALSPGQSHRLRATMQGDELSAAIDERVVWQGELGAAASGLQGPPGVRTDNAQLLFELALDAPAASAGAAPVCRSGAQESD
jgi:hypothetical protein